MSTRGFIKLQRGDVTDELIRDKNALHLLTVIALRARFRDAPNLAGLGFGQAYVGDFKEYDMTEKEYRCAKQRLERFGLVRFKGTPKGTVATLIDGRAFELRDTRSGVNRGGHEGGHEGGQNSEEKSPFGADRGANATTCKGRTRGERRVTNSACKHGQSSQNINTHSDLGNGASAPGGPALTLTLNDPADDRAPREKAEPRVFRPPTPLEVEMYSREIAYPLDGQAWCDSYAAKGWMIGKARMKDWRAAVRNWKANGWIPNSNAHANSNRKPNTSTYELERRVHGYTL